MTVPRITALTAVLYLVLSTASALHAQDRMRAGNWENTVTIADGQTATRNACLSAKDAAMSNGSALEIRAETEKAIAKSGRCQLKDFAIDAKGKTETMVCGTDTIHNETTFHGGDSFETTTTRTKGGVVTVAHSRGTERETVKRRIDDWLAATLTPASMHYERAALLNGV